MIRDGMLSVPEENLSFYFIRRTNGPLSIVMEEPNASRYLSAAPKRRRRFENGPGHSADRSSPPKDRLLPRPGRFSGRSYEQVPLCRSGGCGTPAAEKPHRTGTAVFPTGHAETFVFMQVFSPRHSSNESGPAPGLSETFPESPVGKRARSRHGRRAIFSRKTRTCRYRSRTSDSGCLRPPHR